jgi:hypothetical protein
MVPSDNERPIFAEIIWSIRPVLHQFSDTEEMRWFKDASPALQNRD